MMANWLFFLGSKTSHRNFTTSFVQPSYLEESPTNQLERNIAATMASADGPMDPEFSPPEFSPTPPPISEVNCCEQNKVVVSILIGLVVLLSIFFIAMLSPSLNRCIHRHTPVSDERIERRYETIEGWIISKVRERKRETKA
jgi:hypothetical protein